MFCLKPEYLGMGLFCWCCQPCGRSSCSGVCLCLRRCWWVRVWQALQ